MKVTSLPNNGNSSKFTVTTKKGDFVLAFSFTLRTKIWTFDSLDAELTAAEQLAEAIVSRHDPALPFKSIYIFAEHNSSPSLYEEIKRIRKQGFAN